MCVHWELVALSVWSCVPEPVSTADARNFKTTRMRKQHKNQNRTRNWEWACEREKQTMHKAEIISASVSVSLSNPIQIADLRPQFQVPSLLCNSCPRRRTLREITTVRCGFWIYFHFYCLWPIQHVLLVWHVWRALRIQAAADAAVW